MKGVHRVQRLSIEKVVAEFIHQLQLLLYYEVEEIDIEIEEKDITN